MVGSHAALTLRTCLNEHKLMIVGPKHRGDTAYLGGGSAQPPRRIMSKKSRLFLVAFILSSTNSIASISSML